MPWALALIGWAITPEILPAPTHPGESFAAVVAAVDWGTMLAVGLVRIGPGSSDHRGIALLLKLLVVVCIGLSAFVALTAALPGSSVDLHFLEQTALAPFGAAIGLIFGVWLVEVCRP